MSAPSTRQPPPAPQAGCTPGRHLCCSWDPPQGTHPSSPNPTNGPQPELGPAPNHPPLPPALSQLPSRPGPIDKSCIQLSVSPRSLFPVSFSPGVGRGPGPSPFPCVSGRGPVPREKRGAAESRLDLKHFNAKDVFDKSRRRFQPGLEMRVALALKKTQQKGPGEPKQQTGDFSSRSFPPRHPLPLPPSPHGGPWVEAPASGRSETPRQHPRTACLHLGVNYSPLAKELVTINARSPLPQPPPGGSLRLRRRLRRGKARTLIGLRALQPPWPPW